MLSKEVVDFFKNQNFVIISTIDEKGAPHNACKGIIKITRQGKVYLLDLYRLDTYNNLRNNPNISITGVDEHRFKGYCLKGRVERLNQIKLSPQIIRAWEERITSRITQRVLRNVRGEKGHMAHPETLLPKPEYMIVVQVAQVIDLTPHALK